MPFSLSHTFHKSDRSTLEVKVRSAYILPCQTPPSGGIYVGFCSSLMGSLIMMLNLIKTLPYDVMFSSSWICFENGGPCSCM